MAIQQLCAGKFLCVIGSWICLATKILWLNQAFTTWKQVERSKNSRHCEYILVSIVDTLRFNCEPAQLLFRVRSKPSSLRNYSNATEGGSTVLVSLAESMFSIADRTRVWMCFILHWNRASKLRIFIVNEHKKSQNSNFELKTTVGAFQILNLIFFFVSVDAAS